MLKLSLGTTFEQLSCQTLKVVFTLGMAQEDIWSKAIWRREALRGA